MRSKKTRDLRVRTPCIAACKNNHGICGGCHRTIREIIDWKKMSDDQRDQVIAELYGESNTHQCPNCGSAAHCDIAAGKSQCWCFELEKRATLTSAPSNLCLCRRCLSEQELI